MPQNLRAVIVYMSLLFVVSCGGGGGGGENPPPSNGVLNPGLEGRILFREDGLLYSMDTETGLFSTVPNTNWKQQTDRFQFPAVTDFSASPIPYDTTEFLGIGEEVDTSYIFMQDYQGNVLGQFALDGSVLSGSMSQDHQYVALFRQPGSVSSTPWFSLYTRDGRFLEDRQLGKRQLLWLRDNRILYSSGRSFYFTHPVSTQADYSLTLPDPSGGVVTAGVIGDKTISPDESQIVFTVAESGGDLINGAQNSRLYIMNMDGTGLRLLATTYNDEEPSIIQPTWSPDGRWILVKEDYKPVGLDANSLGYRYVIPSDQPGKVFYLSPDGSERSPEVIKFRHYSWENSGITSRGSPNVFIWIPDY